jgi:hypothetical protein
LANPETGEVLKKMRGSKTGAHIAIVKLPVQRRVVRRRTSLRGAPIGDNAFWAAGHLDNLADRGCAHDQPSDVEATERARADRAPSPAPDPVLWHCLRSQGPL